MSKERREKLLKKAGRRLAASFRKVLRSDKPEAIDIEMFWPPDHDEIGFLVQSDGRDSLAWDFALPTAHWRIASDPKVDFPTTLLADVRAFFRATWKEVRKATGTNARAYLRLHEDNSAIDLTNGRRINDCDRPNYSIPDRKSFKKRGRPATLKRRNGELIRRGDRLSKVKKAYHISDDPDGIDYYWPERGIRIGVQRGVVNLVAYFAPFPDAICGIWIGARASEVDKILGRAKREFFQPHRLWHYDLDGFMSVGFDRNDRVDFIGR